MLDAWWVWVASSTRVEAMCKNRYESISIRLIISRNFLRECFNRLPRTLSSVIGARGNTLSYNATHCWLYVEDFTGHCHRILFLKIVYNLLADFKRVVMSKNVPWSPDLSLVPKQPEIWAAMVKFIHNSKRLRLKRGSATHLPLSSDHNPSIASLSAGRSLSSASRLTAFGW